MLADKGRFCICSTQGDPVANCLDLQFTPGRQVELLSQRLRHDKATCAINGNDHAVTVFRVATGGQWRRGGLRPPRAALALLKANRWPLDALRALAVWTRVRFCRRLENAVAFSIAPEGRA